MSNQSPIDAGPVLTAWLERDTGLRPPKALTERILGYTAATRSLPAWLIPERWFPMETSARFGAIPRAVQALVVRSLLAALLAAGAALGAGSGPSQAVRTEPSTLGPVSIALAADCGTQPPSRSASP
jgi:hypothetical protein